MAEPRQKTPAEIKAKLRVLLHNAQKRFIEQKSIPCPENCKHAAVLGTKVQPCPKCQANPGEPCRIKLRFEQRHTYDQLKVMFRTRAGQKAWISRELRDCAMLLWVMGEMDPSEEPDGEPLPDYLQPHQDTQAPAWMHLDGRTLYLSEDVTALFAGFLEKVAERMPPPPGAPK